MVLRYFTTDSQCSTPFGITEVGMMFNGLGDLPV